MIDVTAVLVTRGDVDLAPVLASLPPAWEVIVWDNSVREDLAVYGRYAALEEVATALVYCQDDDCIVSDPQALVRAWHESRATAVNDARSLLHESPENLREIAQGRHVVCNMPARFRHDFYVDHALVGFGAVFQRDAPARAFARWFGTERSHRIDDTPEWSRFYRTCDIVFTGLTRRVLVDVPHEDREFASAPGRMWMSHGHVQERKEMLDLVRQVRDS